MKETFWCTYTQCYVEIIATNPLENTTDITWEDEEGTHFQEIPSIYLRETFVESI